MKLLGPFFLIALIYSCTSNSSVAVPDTDWAHYLGDPSTTQYSALEQINVENVAKERE